MSDKALCGSDACYLADLAPRAIWICIDHFLEPWASRATLTRPTRPTRPDDNHDIGLGMGSRASNFRTLQQATAYPVFKYLLCMCLTMMYRKQNQLDGPDLQVVEAHNLTHLHFSGPRCPLQTSTSLKELVWRDLADDLSSNDNLNTLTSLDMDMFSVEVAHETKPKFIPMTIYFGNLHALRQLFIEGYLHQDSQYIMTPYTSLKRYYSTTSLT